MNVLIWNLLTFDQTTQKINPDLIRITKELLGNCDCHFIIFNRSCSRCVENAAEKSATSVRSFHYLTFIKPRKNSNINVKLVT